MKQKTVSMKKKILSGLQKIRSWSGNGKLVFCHLAVIMAAAIIAVSPAMAAADAKAIFNVILKAAGVIFLISGAIRAVMGLAAYAEAKEEGEGPAMSKAKNQLISAIVLGALGAGIAAGAETLSGLISNISL